MAKATFNKRFLDGAKVPAGKIQMDYAEGKPPFLILRVSGTVKAWFIVYRLHGRQRRLKLGRYPDISYADARELAFEARRKIASGIDPKQAGQEGEQALTFAELCDLYMRLHSEPNKRSTHLDRQMLARDILPALGTLPAAAVERRDIVRLVDHVTARSGHSGNRTLALISGIFNFGVDRDLVSANPAHRIKPRFKAISRDRVLTPDEISRVWSAMASHNHVAGSIMRIMLLTGQRGGEVRQMRWSDLDMNTRWWTIPSEIAKNGRSHRVPLTPSVIAIIELQSQTSNYVFPSNSKGTAPVSRDTLTRYIQTVAAESSVDFHGHDLRRSAASCMASIGVERFTIERLLNHTDRSITAIYDRHSYDNEKRRALERYEACLNRVVDDLQPKGKASQFYS